MKHSTLIFPRSLTSWLPAVCLWLWMVPVFAAPTNDDFSAVTKLIQGWVDQDYYPGAAMLVAKDNRVIYQHCFGNYTPATPVFIASAGKWLAAATIMSVVDEGKLSLDDHPSRWLPEFKNDPKDRATLRQMLAHTSGYPAYQPADNPIDHYRLWPNPSRIFCLCRWLTRPASVLITAVWPCRWPDV